MKTALAAFCGLVALLAAGTALILLTQGTGAVQGLPPGTLLALIPGAVALLNAVLLALFFRRRPQGLGSLYGLAGFDLLYLIFFLVA